MDSYLHTPERDEQRGRPEDGPVGMKKKFTEWPNQGAQQHGAKSSKSKSKVSTPKTTSTTPVKGTGGTSHTVSTGAKTK